MVTWHRSNWRKYELANEIRWLFFSLLFALFLCRIQILMLCNFSLRFIVAFAVEDSKQYNISFIICACWAHQESGKNEDEEEEDEEKKCWMCGDTFNLCKSFIEQYIKATVLPRRRIQLYTLHMYIYVNIPVFTCRRAQVKSPWNIYPVLR